MALRGGADEFIAKPWDTDEMLERVAGVLRRCCRSPVMIDESLTVGELVLVYGSVHVGGVRLDLTKTEHLLLSAVAHLGRLRRKLIDAGVHDVTIRTAAGVA